MVPILESLIEINAGLEKQLQLSRIHLSSRGIIIHISFLVLSSLAIISQRSDLNIDMAVKKSPYYLGMLVDDLPS